MEINGEKERGEGWGQQHTAAKPMQLHETQNLQQHLSEFPIYQLQDRIAFAALKTNGTGKKKSRKSLWGILKLGKKLTISIYLQYDYEILNSPHPNKKPSSTIELVQNIVYTKRCLKKHQRDTGRKKETIRGEKEKKKKTPGYFHT